MATTAGADVCATRKSEFAESDPIGSRVKVLQRISSMKRNGLWLVVVALAALSGCSKPNPAEGNTPNPKDPSEMSKGPQPKYEDDFATLTGDIAAGSLTEEDQTLRQDRLDVGAPSHEEFLLEQIKSPSQVIVSQACWELRYVKDDKASEALLDLAKKTDDDRICMSAVQALGHQGYQKAYPYIKSLVEGPYDPRSAWAVAALYRLNPKDAMNIFRERINGADEGSEGYAKNAKTFMAAFILNSDPKGQSGYVLSIIHKLRSRYDNSELLDKLETAAKAQAYPYKVLKPYEP